jgi:hypothetical protein
VRVPASPLATVHGAARLALRLASGGSRVRPRRHIAAAERLRSFPLRHAPLQALVEIRWDGHRSRWPAPPMAEGIRAFEAATRRRSPRHAGHRTELACRRRASPAHTAERLAGSGLSLAVVQPRRTDVPRAAGHVYRLQPRLCSYQGYPRVSESGAAALLRGFLVGLLAARFPGSGRCMRAPELCVLPHGGFAKWMRRRCRFGAQNKVPRVISDPELFADLRAFEAQFGGEDNSAAR